MKSLLQRGARLASTLFSSPTGPAHALFQKALALDLDALNFDGVSTGNAATLSECDFCGKELKKKQTVIAVVAKLPCIAVASAKRETGSVTNLFVSETKSRTILESENGRGSYFRGRLVSVRDSFPRERSQAGVDI